MSAVGNKALTSLVSCSPSPAMHPSCHSSVPTFYNGMKIVHLFKNKSQTWVKEGGGGHPTRLLLVVQQLVAGLEVLVTVLTAVLPFLCTVGGRNISILCILVRYMRCSGLGNWQKRVLVRVCGADHEYQEPWCHMNTLQPSWKVAAPHRGKSLWWLCRRSATHTHTHMIKIVLFYHSLITEVKQNWTDQHILLCWICLFLLSCEDVAAVFVLTAFFLTLSITAMWAELPNF